MEDKFKKEETIEELLAQVDNDDEPLPVYKQIAIFGGSFDPPTHIHFKVGILAF